MSAPRHDEMTAAAIARLAGVGRAAVSNWRRRYPDDFPRPVGGSPTSPTFSRAEVEAWLVTTGKVEQLVTTGHTATETRRVADPTWLREVAGGAVTGVTSGQLLARVVVSLLPDPTTATPFERPLDGDEIEDDVPAVLDPTCGDATLLAAVADRFGDSVRLVGQEIQESTAAVAALNLRDHTSGAAYEIHTGNSLLDDRLRAYGRTAAAVVCEPPLDGPQWPHAELSTDPRWEFGTPAPRDGELAWVQHCYAHLRPRGVAVVAVSPRTCVQPSGQHIRAALVRSGVLRDVIALPKGMGSPPDAGVYLWVLQRPYGTSGDPALRMVDLSGWAEAADVPHELAVWERLFDDGTVCRPVPRMELLDGDTNLLPSRYVATGVEASVDDIARVTDRLQALYARIGRGLPRFTAPESPPHYAYVTLAELERAGALTIRSRDTTPRAGDVLLRSLGRPPAVATGTAADDPGVTQVVEIDGTRLDPHFVATFLRTDAHALPVTNTLGTLNRDDLRRCRIPRMALTEQRRYGHTFRRLHDLQGTLSALATVSGNVLDQTLHGLMTGALTPGAGETEGGNEL